MLFSAKWADLLKLHFNCGNNSTEVTLHLLKTKCIPVFLYGLEALLLNKSQMSSIDFVINRFFMKLFNTNNNIEVVKCCQQEFCFRLPSLTLAHRTEFFLGKIRPCENLLVKKLVYVRYYTLWHYQLCIYIYICIGHHIQAFEWYHFQWAWVTSNPDFKVYSTPTSSKGRDRVYLQRPINRKSHMVYRTAPFSMTLNNP